MVALVKLTLIQDAQQQSLQGKQPPATLTITPTQMPIVLIEVPPETPNPRLKTDIKPKNVQSNVPAFVRSQKTVAKLEGGLPPNSVKQCESKGNYQAKNRSSSASGAYQIIDSTWANYQGYPTAASAPPSVQDEKARQLWAGGRGRSHWSECGA